MPKDLAAGPRPAERAVVRADITGWVLVWPLIWTALSFGLLAIVTVPWLAFGLVFRRTTEVKLDGDRLVQTTGFLRRKAVELPLAEIETLRLAQTPVGRAFNYGSVVASGRGLTFRIFGSLTDPAAFKRAIEAEMGRLDGATPASSAA